MFTKDLLSRFSISATGTKSVGLGLSLFFIANAIVIANSLSPQEQTRGLHVKKIEENRPAASAPADPKQPRTYRSATSNVSASDAHKSGAGEAVIGVTLWRLRQARSTDNQDARILEHQPARNQEWAAERMEADARLKEGERVRLSIESPSTGFLYVIDREEYSNGSIGDPFVIFPTTRTRGGNNSVVGGKVIEFPGQGDNPPYFTLTRSRADHVGELLIIIASPRQIPELQSLSDAAPVPADKLVSWEKDWGGRVERFELEGGAGLPYTGVEKTAGGDGSRMLTQGDPLPQTILRVNAKTGEPTMVKLHLRIAD